MAENDALRLERFPTWLPASALVAIGGVLGTLARHGVDVWAVPHMAKGVLFPWPTFAINVAGSAVLGFVMAWVEESAEAPGWLRPFAAIGFCGSFTTFSTMSVEILLLARHGRPELAFSYLVASLVCGIVAVTVATAIGVRMFRSPGAEGSAA